MHLLGRVLTHYVGNPGSVSSTSDSMVPLATLPVQSSQTGTSGVGHHKRLLFACLVDWTFFLLLVFFFNFILGIWVFDQHVYYKPAVL